MSELFSDLTSITILPATVAVLILFLWSLLTILFGIGADLSLGDWLPSGQGGIGEADLGGLSEASPQGPIPTAAQHAHDSMGFFLLSPLRWLNIGSVPLFLWAGIFAICWWVLSFTTYYFLDVPLFSKPIPWYWAIPILVRNLCLGLLATKYITRSMNVWFQAKQLTSQDLIGREVIICSYDASPEHGQAKFKTNGAPLLLNVHTDGPILSKGTVVWITHYDPKKRIYQVSATTTSSQLETS